MTTYNVYNLTFCAWTTLTDKASSHWSEICKGLKRHCTRKPGSLSGNFYVVWWMMVLVKTFIKRVNHHISWKGSGTLLTMCYSTCTKYNLSIGTLLWKVSQILLKKWDGLLSLPAWISRTQPLKNEIRCTHARTKCYPHYAFLRGAQRPILKFCSLRNVDRFWVNISDTAT